MKMHGRDRVAGRRTASDKIFDILNILFMSLIALVILYPLYFVLVASFTTPRMVKSGRLLLYPVEFFAGGYAKTFSYAPIWRGYLNTIIYTSLGTLVSVSTTVASGYALSRRDMFGQRPLMFLFTFTMFFGGGMIPSYLLMRDLGIYNTIWVMVLPSAISVYNLIVCRSFYSRPCLRSCWKRPASTDVRTSDSSSALRYRCPEPSWPS